MKKLLSLLLAFTALIWVVSCNEEDSKEPPVASAPSGVTNVSKGGSVDLSFSVATPEGYKSTAASGVGGTVTIKSEPAAGETSGTVVVTFTAGTTAGAASTSIVVTDDASQTATATAVLNIQETDKPAVTAPAITSVQRGKMVDISFTVSTAGGYASSEVVASSGSVVIKSQPAANDASGSVVVTFTAPATEGAAAVTLVVTDAEGEEGSSVAAINVSSTHAPVISGIPATASLEFAGDVLGPVNATIDMDDVPGTLTITKNGAAFSTVNITTDGQVVAFQYTSMESEANTNITFAFTAEDSDGDETSVTHVLTVGPVNSETIVKSGIITENETWTSNNIYELAGKVVVDSAVTLTIEAGTIIKARTGEGSLASALIVARYGNLMAEGTSSAPIIFTSVEDNIEVGQTVGTNLDAEDAGLWGGLLILGNATISASAAEIQIEGIPADETYGLYGGSDDNDNSGVIKYISIRHSGTVIGEGNEINGLTLGGVGSGTVIENVEIVGNLDDGIEFFGGTVDVTNALVWGQEDDGYDIDQAYRGTIDNFIYIAGAKSDHALEIDGPEGSLLGRFTMKNGSLKGGFSVANTGEYADFRSEAQGTVEDCYFFGFAETSDLELDNAGVSDNYFAATPTLEFSGLEFNVSHLSTGNITVSGIFKDDGGNDANFPRSGEASIVTTKTVGADKTKFTWTFANAKGALTDF